MSMDTQSPPITSTETSPPKSGAPVVLENLTRRFGTTTALDGFTLQIAPGEFVALLGPSGCGKTTALRVLAGFERPDIGRVTVDGNDVVHIPAQKRDMGMVFQSYSLFPNMTARDNVAFGLRLRHQRSASRRTRAEELLDLVGLAEHTTKYPHQLSGGQQQRVALARALAIEPRVLLLDEPLSALDAKVRAELRDQIRALQQRLMITTVFVTHDQEEALSMADRVCVMSRGRAEQIATPAELYSRPSTEFVAQFVGISSRVGVQRTGDSVTLFGRDVKIRGAAPDGAQSLDALLRPEDVDVLVAPTGLGLVTHKSFLGATTRLEVGIGGASVKVDVFSSAADVFDIGTRVDLVANARDVLVTASRPAT
jgi:putative spermidine/putrescine transport system ATP-binding protein